MATRERVCAECGAINRLNADACWRCLELLQPLQPLQAETAAVAPEPGPHRATA